jgi:hypothetical protein
MKSKGAQTLAGKPADKEVTPATKDTWRTGLSLGTLTLAATVILLYLLNVLIYDNYHPDTKAALDQIVPLSFLPRDWFGPEPVERLQYQLSLLCLPFFIYGAYRIISRLRGSFEQNQRIAIAVNAAGIFSFIVFFVELLSQKVLYITDVKDADTTYYFSKNLVGAFPGTAMVVLSFYLLTAYLFVLYARKANTVRTAMIVDIVSYCIVAFVLFDVFSYNKLRIGYMKDDMMGEINAVFYSITQVYAGKSLLVDFNAQYGLYAWFLKPVFKLVGLSTYNFGMVMGLLNCTGFLFLYLGIRRLLSDKLMALLVFLCLIMWQFWQSRIPYAEETHDYYQYWPLRMLFPCAVFYLLTLFFTSARAKKAARLLLPVVTAIGILWNPDTGIVIFGAVLITMVVAEFHQQEPSVAIRNSVRHAVLMFGGLALVILWFMLATRIHSGHWPDLAQAARYQSIFYGSGFFMLPMSAFHFWNVPALVYVAAGVYCVANLRKNDRKDVPVMVFLFVAGAGLFSYFQGRSYDLTVNAVMYPAIIAVGIFCDKLFSNLNNDKKWLHESSLIWLLLFLFIADGAFSMVYNTPGIHEAAMLNADQKDDSKEKSEKAKEAFMHDNFHDGDTVLILARNEESYLYAIGGYVNPMNIAGSTEWFFKTDLDTVLHYLRDCRYPIIYDFTRPMPIWYLKDTVLQAFVDHKEVVKGLAGTGILLLRPAKTPHVSRLVPDASTVYYNDLGMYNAFSMEIKKPLLSNNFSIEFIATIDTTRAHDGDMMFTNASDKVPFTGVLLEQDGPDRTNYVFGLGNGKAWTGKVNCKLNSTGENHVLIEVKNNVVTVVNNGNLCGTATADGTVKNADGVFVIDKAYPGMVKELKVSGH